MEKNDKILMNRDKLEKMQSKLKGLKVTVQDKDARVIIRELLELIEEDLNIEQIPIKDIIHEKMDETKFSDPDLNFKLYMLCRKLEENKISEDEAIKAYDLYIRS